MSNGVVVDSLQAPAFAGHRPHRAVEIHDVAGRPQVVCWDRDTDTRRVLTNATHGVDTYDIEPGGGFVWWFNADTAGEGTWQRQSFETGPPEAALHGVPPGRPYGIAFDATGHLSTVCVGVGTESRCYVGPPGGSGRLVATAPGYVSLVDMTADGQLIALAGRSDSPHAISVIRLADGDTEVLAGTRHRRLWALEFQPGAGTDAELLIIVEADGRYTVGTWRRERGTVLSEHLSFDSEITAHWYRDHHQVLIQQDRAGRSRLLLAHLDGGAVNVIPTPPGTILDLACAPEGTIHYVWSRESMPPRRLVADLISGRDTTPSPTPVAPARPERGEVWTTQPYGRIHSFLATPPGVGPWPTLFLVHGGPFLHDRDSYDPRVELLTRSGYAVVRTNYRGSTGYGPRWRHGFGHRVGLAQLDDLHAVRRHLVDLKITDPHRIGLCGYSWGGYLVLLAMGAQPDEWAVGLAVSPVADYATAYRSTIPALREVDEELFGGTPEEVPERYRAANPMTYLDTVQGPLFIAAATGDERCPAEPVERYVAALRRRSVPHQLLWTAGGHHGSAADQTAIFTALLRYADTVLRPGNPPRSTAPSSSSPDGRAGRSSDQIPIRQGR